MNPITLSQKRILVTGASSGIGRETAIYLSKLGASVNITARNQERLYDTMEQLEGTGHSYYPFDLQDVGKIENLIKQMISEKGPLDGIVYCAGISPVRGLNLAKTKHLEEVMAVNFYSFVEIVRCASVKLRYCPGASFIGISSVRAVKPNKSQVAYAASKAAMDAAMRVMAKELAPKSIRVNTIRPGAVHTEMHAEFMALNISDQPKEVLMADQYLGIAEPQDIAAAAAYLLSDASRFVTGTSLLVDGGFLS